MRLDVLLSLSLMTIAGCGSDYEISEQTDAYGLPIECEVGEVVPYDIAPIERCLDPDGGFNPIVEWDGGIGEYSRALVSVADLDLDGMPEIISNHSSLLPGGPGVIVATRGDGSGELWRVNASAGYASGPVTADLDDDGYPEVLVVKAVGSQIPMLGETTYSVVAYDHTGLFVWESDSYAAEDFDYATGLIVADMDHDGLPEIVAGRVILNWDGSLRGKGEHGHGSYGVVPIMNFSEGSLPAVSDLDLDGVSEVITGNAHYSPDGETLWFDPSQEDGMIAVANLDDDPEGEYIACSFATVRAVDTDGSIIWGPLTIETAHILSPAAIGDIDNDGYPEIIVAGGSKIVALNHDGTELWSNPVQDQSGATGASLFDFEGDGILEVVYIDEVQMVAYDGMTGAVKFYSGEHASATMMDYPVIADVDADGQVEIVVAHDKYTSAYSVYGDEFLTWRPGPSVWNQHAFTMDNINDDLSVPIDPPPSFTTHNTWHSGVDPRGVTESKNELGVELIQTCDVACYKGDYYVLAHVVNRSQSELPPGIDVALYATVAGVDQLLDVQSTAQVTPSGSTGESLTFVVAASAVRGADTLKLSVDDDGAGVGQYPECNEENNIELIPGPFCE